MIMKVRFWADGGEVAVPKDGDAINAIGTQVENPASGFVAVGYFVGYHYVRIIPKRPGPFRI